MAMVAAQLVQRKLFGKRVPYRTFEIKQHAMISHISANMNQLA